MQSASIIVAICSLAVAALTFIFNRNGDSKNSTAALTEVSVKLSFLSSQLADIQKDLRANANEITRLHEEMDKEIARVEKLAQHAKDRADAAHNRLDRAHVDIKEE